MCESPLKPGHGFADYLLYVDGAAVGLVEAKPPGITLTAVEIQTTKYSIGLPETFDFIVTDECHRSIYNLWRQVLEYFDASLIGLTVTPSKQTLGFFNQKRRMGNCDHI